MEKEYKVFMPNRSFTGFRNGFKERSIPFKDGVSQIPLTEREAEIFVKNYGYFCPELTGEMLPWEIEEAEAGDKNTEAGDGSPDTGEDKKPESEPESEPESNMSYVEKKKSKKSKK